jgi:hypothetical protein
MNSLKDTLRSYQKNLDRGEFYYNQDDHQNALKYYNLAIGELYNAKEMCQYSDELQTLKEKDGKFKSWLHNKTQSIKSQLSALVKYTKELQQSVNYAVTLNKTTKTVTEPQSTTRLSSPNPKKTSKDLQPTSSKSLSRYKSPSSSSSSRYKSPSSPRYKSPSKSSSSSSRHSPQSPKRKKTDERTRRHSSKHNDSFPDLDDDLDDDQIISNSRNERTERTQTGTESNSNWKELAERSIKLLCHLRGIYDFNDKDKEFEKIFRQRQIYIKEERQ